MFSVVTSALNEFCKLASGLSKEAVVEAEGGNEQELSKLAEVLKEMSERDRKLLGKFLRGYTHEELCSMLDMNIDQLRSEASRVRWQFKELVMRHGLDKSSDPKVQRLIKQTYSLLSK